MGNLMKKPFGIPRKIILKVTSRIWYKFLDVS
jgi:hypothetical protein